MPFDNAGLYALQISICSDNSRGESDSNPGGPGTTEDKPATGLSNRAQSCIGILVRVVNSIFILYTASSKMLDDGQNGKLAIT